MDTPNSINKKTSFSSLSKSSSLTPCRRLGLSRPSPGALQKSAKLLINNTPENKKDTEKEGTCHNNIECKDVTKRISSTGDILKQNLSKKYDSLRTPQKQQHITVKRSMDTPIDCRNFDSNSPYALDQQNVRSKCDSGQLVKKRKLTLKSEPSSKDDMAYEKNVSSSQDKSIATLVSTTDISNVNGEECRIKEVTPELIQSLVHAIKEKKNKLELLKVQETYRKKHKLEDVRGQTAQWRLGGQEALRYSLLSARQSGVQITLLQLMAQHGFLPHLMGYDEEYDDFSDNNVT